MVKFFKTLTLLVLVVFAVTVTSCAGFLSALRGPDNHNEARYGVVRVQMSHAEWDSTHIEFAREALVALNRLGPSFVLVESGGDVAVYDVDLTTSIQEGGCSDVHCAARYFETSHRIEIDPTLTPGELAFETALMHELGHFLGMEHVCRHPGETSVCSPVGYGRAVMNPSLLYGRDVFSAVHAYRGPMPTWEVQDLDVREFERVRVAH